MMRCLRCNVEIERDHGYLEVRITANKEGNGRHVTSAYCTFFCAAVAMDIMCLTSIEKVNQVTTLPQAQNWIQEHSL